MHWPLNCRRGLHLLERFQCIWSISYKFWSSISQNWVKDKQKSNIAKCAMVWVTLFCKAILHFNAKSIEIICQHYEISQPLSGFTVSRVFCSSLCDYLDTRHKMRCWLKHTLNNPKEGVQKVDFTVPHQLVFKQGSVRRTLSSLYLSRHGSWPSCLSASCFSSPAKQYQMHLSDAQWQKAEPFLFVLHLILSSV